MKQIRPVLKRLHSPDIADLESFSPDNPASFSFLLQVMFGPEGDAGEESFDIVVCTPGWLATEVERKQVLNGHHHLVVNTFDIQQVRSFLAAYANACVGNTWQEAAMKLSRLGKWEFEDYNSWKSPS